MAAVVILPGLDGTAALLGDFCATLTALGVPARAIAYPPDRPFGYDELEPLVRSQLPSTAPFVVLGESFSGPLAIRIAADPPPGLVGLVLSTTFACAPVRGLSPLAPLVRLAPARLPPPLLSWALLGPWVTPHLRAQLAAALRIVSPGTLRARTIAALREDVSVLLGSVHVPVLQLVASRDRLLAKAASEQLAAHLPSCDTITLPGPHLLLQTATQPAAEVVAAFALGLDPDDSSEPAPPGGAA